ncbi:CCA tRNA nucleotidyltransferase [Roseiconus nitratireducens]|uniref:CCA tRNA nucleotidyltransferase n=1 Tax=Roseiconus nitratireducens TaxID=2605748 RepID=A0A5M6CZG9_9BACT|nr:CCA tRNA nucleotidyltransferase [Roseiconus nitratireducens]KAA5540637.1 CCA tRNA nucleotidyltransferase [Roseiconus nitratireducens]
MTHESLFLPSQENASSDTRAAYAEAIRICRRLRDAGHIAYFAGGCVRDALLGRTPKDFDVATDATPDRVREVFGFRRTLAFGASFGVIGVLPEKRRQKSPRSPSDDGPPPTHSPPPGPSPTEVATFRSDGDYSDGRRPDRVHYGDARHDALRRDFTINGLFFDPATEDVIDFVGGRSDLNRRILRTIGVPAERFDEDKLRMLRAVRFAATLELTLDDQTQLEIVKRAAEIALVSPERVGAEMRRVVVSPHATKGLRLLAGCGLDRRVMPALDRADFSKLHEVLSHRPSLHFESSLALILHSIASDGDRPWETLLSDLASRWRLSNEEIRRVRTALRDWKVVADSEHLPWSRVQPVLIDRDAHFTLDVASAIQAAKGDSLRGVARSRQATEWPAEKLAPPPLVTGDMLRQAGYRPGPQFREWLQAVRDRQLDGKLQDAEQALDFVRQLAKAT